NTYPTRVGVGSVGILFAVYVISAIGASNPSELKEIVYSVLPYASLITSCGEDKFCAEHPARYKQTVIILKMTTNRPFLFIISPFICAAIYAAQMLFLIALK